MAHILIHSLEDSLVLLPFLFGTYLVIEILETAAGEHAKKLITGAGKGSVAVGAALGVVPQCGFSAVAAGFYSKGIIGAGALLAGQQRQTFPHPGEIPDNHVGKGYSADKVENRECHIHSEVQVYRMPAPVKNREEGRSHKEKPDDHNDTAYR